MRLSTSFAGKAAALLLATQSVMGIELNLNDDQSIKNAASSIAYKMMTFYPGNKTGGIPGLLGDPYYWWEAGAMFGSLIDYWYYTGDTSYNPTVMEGMLHQVGDNQAFMPQNQTKSLGNDDQAFWGMAAMSAAEVNFPNPPSDQPQWLALAQAVFNSQAPRWNTEFCSGGLKWQIFTFNNGYNYKNTISNGCLFNLAARLHAYTGNDTYSDWANKAWDWTAAIGLMSSDYKFFDGTDDTKNCSEINHIQWSYNAGVYMYGAAMMYNATQGSDLWKGRVQNIWDAAKVFFTGTNNQVMYEAACEPGGTCNVDQQSFKAYLARWMAASLKVAPFLHDQMMPYLVTSANAAAQSCVGTEDQRTCGTKWTVQGYDGLTGVGQHMSALEVIQSNLIDRVAGPLSNTTGGTSKGNYLAGTGNVSPIAPERTITTGDRAGAGIITALILAALVGGAWWMIA